jgi:hypothetical protein
MVSVVTAAALRPYQGALISWTTKEDMLLAEGLTKIRDIVGPLKRLIPRPFRKRIYFLVANRAIEKLPARVFLGEAILPALQGRTRMLFVGCRPYNLNFYRECEAKGIAVWTIDIDPKVARWGAPRHLIGDVREVDLLVSGLRFDIIIANGLLGFGVNCREDAEQTVDALIRVADVDALLIVGWNPGLTDNSEIEAFRTKLTSTTIGPLDIAIEFSPRKPLQPTPHRYEFFRI